MVAEKRRGVAATYKDFVQLIANHRSPRLQAVAWLITQASFSDAGPAPGQRFDRRRKKPITIAATS
jgi:hypothetical protein